MKYSLMKTIRLALLFVCLAQAQGSDTNSWNRQSAAAYLDSRMAWWASWPSAARDHDTFCVSCHTSLPYALARPALRGALAEQGPSVNERRFLENIAKRVKLWGDVQPFYSDAQNGAPKSAESLGTEAVLNALILTRYESPAAKDALRNMWALQLKSGEKRGSWNWLNFHNEPWEAEDSTFWGAALAGLAVALAPENYRSDPEILKNLALLSDYLQREEQGQSTLNRAVALWASGKLPTLLKPEQRAAIAEEILRQQHEDGGWSASSLAKKDWKRRDGTPLDANSDGYGTGLMVVALDQAHIASAQTQIAKGRAWLEHRQEPSGAWLSTSMNKQRDPDSDAGRFMSDAATAYSVLALSGKILSTAERQ
jgi:squalene-hopene/tetraprenyl-beta-curcumene cyclase